jgi:electron transport complex protein RnfE
MKKQSAPRRLFGIFVNGLVRENPLLILMIGICSSLAVSTSVINAIGMGLSLTFVLLMSELFVSLFRKLIPDAIRIPIFIMIVATFTTIIDYVLKAWFPDLSKAMGVYIPLIVVNCIIMGRAEGFAFKQPVSNVIPDALGMGLGFTWVLAGIALVRELLGNGTILNAQVLPASYQPILFFVLPAGGFFLFALFISLNLFIKSRMKSPSAARNDAGKDAGKESKAGCEDCPASGCMATHCGIPENKGGQA